MFKGKWTRLLGIALCALLAQIAWPVAGSAPPLEDQWDALLKKYRGHATINGIEASTVDYAKIAADPAWLKLLEALETAPEPSGDAARKAFWINAYNILAIKVVLTKYPVPGIKDVGSLLKPVWKQDAGMVAGKTRTLNDIEHEILRKMGDPRIHAAIVCASLSCPDLRAEAFRAEKLDEQLDDQLKLFLANPAKGARFDDASRVLYLSSIFDWFGEDFTKGGKSLQTALLKYLPREIAIKLSADTKIKFLDYDWSLNDSARLKK
ncbi:MAG: DUF547 domain-containing protein [bacterium]